MKTQKILIGTLVAGVSTFFLGWLIYGMMINTFMQENCNNSLSLPMDQMVWWALIASNLVSGLLLSIVLDWSGSTTMAAGIKVGAIVGLLSALAFDLGLYSMTTMFNNFTVIIVDSCACAVMFGLSGMAATWVMSRVGQAKV